MKKEDIETIHFIGIAGSAIAPLAVMMKKKGFRVTGSEHNKVWEPAKSLLENAGIKYTELEFDLQNVKNADIVVIGGSALLKNASHPEYIEAERLNKKIVSYAYVVKNFIKKENSIVVTGSYAKSTITSILIWIFKTADKNPSYMVGGKPIGLKSGVKSTNGNVSIVEGDEYASAWGFDMEPRFIHYDPTHAIITSAEWDHLDIYPTLKSYIEAFTKLTKLVEENDGFLLINDHGENMEKVITEYNGDVASYSTSDENKLGIKNRYYVQDFEYTHDFTEFKAFHNDKKLGKIQTQLIGRHNVENLLAAIAMAHRLGVEWSQIQKAAKTFKGIKRRLEHMGNLKTGALVIDDFAHSPVKVDATLTALRNRYPDKEIIGVYKPRPSIHQTRKILKLYPNVFDNADQIYITKVVQSSDTKPEDRIRGKDMLDIIQTSQPNAHYMVKENMIADELNQNTGKNSIVVLMGASSWDKLVENLNWKN
jgi:UDP-N-acetylmuramate: L-alanyl-gamma-D-glutamyl-meso-diaminopimelate ligase